jgi:hypothetical protein
MAGIIPDLYAPLQPGVAVAVTLGHATTVTHERPPAAWDTKPEAHQGDVPTSRTDTQNVFLCRIGRARSDGVQLRHAEAGRHILSGAGAVVFRSA